VKQQIVVREKKQGKKKSEDKSDSEPTNSVLPFRANEETMYCMDALMVVFEWAMPGKKGNKFLSENLDLTKIMEVVGQELATRGPVRVKRPERAKRGAVAGGSKYPRHRSCGLPAPKLKEITNYLLL